MDAIHAWELDDFYRRLRSVVLDLEEAFAEGRLAQRLVHPDVREAGGKTLVETYRQLVDCPGRPSELRRPAVLTLLDHVRREVFAVENRGTANMTLRRASCPQGPGYPKAAADIWATFQWRTAHLRADQLLALRFWGIGFDFDAPEIDDAVASFIARHAVHWLTRELRSLQVVLSWFRPRHLLASTRIVPLPDRQNFERLMLDILNEHERLARAAELAEDFLGQVDLHVKPTACAGAWEAQVQVTQMADPVKYEQKLRRIKWIDRMVILSPRSLAAFLLDEMQPGAESGVARRTDPGAVWASIPSRPTTMEELAASIRRILIDALRQPVNDPMGPMAHVPPAIRRFIRDYVRHDGERALARGGRPLPAHMRDAVRKLAPQLDISKKVIGAARRAATQAATGRYVTGQKVRGVVSNIVDYGVFISLGDADGLLHVNGIPQSDAPLTVRFAKGQELEVTVERVDALQGRITLTLLPFDLRAAC